MGVVVPPSTTVKIREKKVLYLDHLLYLFLVFSPLQTIKYEIKDKAKKK
jgi:hypothetical protein